MKKAPKIFIEHIIESTELIEEYIEDLTNNKFKKNAIIQDACKRRLEIIGEAVKNLPNAFRKKTHRHPLEANGWNEDVLIHEYFDVDLSLTWSVLKQKLLPIKIKLQDLLTDEQSK